MLIKIVHISDLELNPTFQTTWNEDPEKRIPYDTLQERLQEKPNFRQDTWDWLFGQMNDLLDKIIRNRGADHQLLLISGDVVKGVGQKEKLGQLHKKLIEVSQSGTQIILTTGSHDTKAIEKGKPFWDFYCSKPFNAHPGHNEAPWTVITNPFGERLDLCDNEIAIIGFGDLDGTKRVGGQVYHINRNKYNTGRRYWATQRENLSPRFVIGMSADHYPKRKVWAEDNIYCYIATGGTEGHIAGDGITKLKKGRNKHFVGSRQGRPFRCVGFWKDDIPPWETTACSFTYGLIDTENKTATFKDLSSDTDRFSVDGGIQISYGE
jgi:hypothetical protein